MTQSFDIPDSFTVEELNERLLDAIPEEVAHHVELQETLHGSQQLSDKEVLDNALTIIRESARKCDSPILNKVILHEICKLMLEWHSKTSYSAFEQMDPIQALSWARDAGKFQAILNILETIEVTDSDFTATAE